MAGDCTYVRPPSTSLAPDDVPAAQPVTSAVTPHTVVPSCFGPLDDVACGVQRSHRPDVAVSVRAGFTVQPVAASKSSKNTTCSGGGGGAGKSSTSIAVAGFAERSTWAVTGV